MWRVVAQCCSKLCVLKITLSNYVTKYSCFLSKKKKKKTHVLEFDIANVKFCLKLDISNVEFNAYFAS